MAAYDLTELSTALEYDTVFSSENSVLTWSATRIIVAWNGGTNIQGYVQAFDVNASTGAITAIGTKLSVDGTTNNMGRSAIVKFNDTKFVLVWRDGTAANMKARVFSVDSSGNITTAGAIKTVSSLTNLPNACMIDSTRLLVTGSGSGNDGYAIVLTVNTSTWAITEPNAEIEFDTNNYTGTYKSLEKVDSTHFLTCWNDGGAEAMILTVNASTSAITAESAGILSPVTNSANPEASISLTPLDNDNHFLVTFLGSLADGYAQVIEVNKSTWAVTNVGTGFQLTTSNLDFVTATKLDNTHVIVFYSDNGNTKSFGRVLEISNSWVVTAAGAALEFEAYSAQYPYAATLTDDFRAVCAWSNPSDDDGFIQAFDIEEPPTSAIKTINGLAKANVKTVNGLAIASVKTFNGLA